MKRNLHDLITRLIVLSENAGLREELYKIQNSVSYAPPEMEGYWWNETANCLYVFFPEPVEDWQIKIANVWQGKEE